MTNTLPTRLQTAERGYVIEYAGLTLTRPLTSAADWETLGFAIAQRIDSSVWALGDWLIEGGRDGRSWLGGSTYERAARITGFSKAHLSNAFRTASAFPRSERHRLSFSAHKELLRVPRELRGPIIARAVAGKWSADDVGAHINALRVEEQRTQAPPTVSAPLAVVAPRRLTATYYDSPKVCCPKCSHTFPIKGHKLGVVGKFTE